MSGTISTAGSRNNRHRKFIGEFDAYTGVQIKVLDRLLAGGSSHEGMMLTREITKFSRTTERLEAEYDITGIPVRLLQGIFADALAEDPLLQCVHKIGPQQGAALEPYVSDPFDFNAFDYFLEAFEAGPDEAGQLGSGNKSAALSTSRR